MTKQQLTEEREVEEIDTSRYIKLSPDDILEVLDLTIKGDRENKLIAFLCLLSAYTPDNQFNVSFHAPSSSGKSFIPLEVAKLFPEEDLIALGGASPTSFFHENGEYDKDTNTITVDLERKIIIFVDQPHNGLLMRLRSLLSHDQKEIIHKITDKSQKGGMRTKTIILRGYPAVIHCSANLKGDEQEATRFLMLSPSIEKAKLQAGVATKIRKEANRNSYIQWLNSQDKREDLIERIKAVKQADIQSIIIPPNNGIEERFLKDRRIQQRHMRDIGRVISIIKSFALLNLWFRDYSNSTITVSQDDIDAGLILWESVREAQELNLHPSILDVYKQVICPLYRDKNEDRDNSMSFGPCGVSQDEIRQKAIAQSARSISKYQMNDILSKLEDAGLIYHQPDDQDGRKRVVLLTEDLEGSGKYIKNRGGVTSYS